MNVSNTPPQKAANEPAKYPRAKPHTKPQDHTLQGCDKTPHTNHDISSQLSMQIMPLTQDTLSLGLAANTQSKTKHITITQECMWVAWDNTPLLPTQSASTIKFGGAILDAKKEKKLE